MTSAIDITKPVSGTPTTASVRDNFATAKTELEAFNDTSDAAKGDALIGVKLSATGSVATTLHALLDLFQINHVETYSGVGTGLTGAPRIFSGTKTPTNDDSGLRLGRNITGSDLFSHGFRDESTFSSTVSGGYASFDTVLSLAGSLNPYNHITGYQARMSYDGSGVLSDMTGFSVGYVANGVVTNTTGIRVIDTTGTGTVGTQYGIKIDNLAKGSTNWSIHTGSAKSLLGGVVGIGSPAVNSGLLEVIKTSGDCIVFITADSGGSAILNLFPNGGGNTAQISAVGANTLKLRTNNTDALFINSSQLVGIGATPANSGQLEVIKASGDCAAWVTANSVGSASLNLFPNGGGAAQISAVGAVSLKLRTNSNDRWTINSSGHLLGATDNSYDIGAAGATRPRTGYFGTSLLAPFLRTDNAATGAAVNDTVQFYGTDDAAGHTIPSFYCEGTNVLATGQADSASSVRVKIRVNGTVVTLLGI